MLRAIEAGEIDVVIVYKIDRLTRSVADFYDMTRSWFEREVKSIANFLTKFDHDMLP